MGEQESDAEGGDAEMIKTFKFDLKIRVDGLQERETVEVKGETVTTALTKAVNAFDGTHFGTGVELEGIDFLMEVRR